MARPFSATDDDILNAAELVMTRDGQQAFTLSAVAREVGLTRTAISMRFANASILKQMTMDRFVAEFEKKVRGLEVAHGASGLLAVADLLAHMVGARERLVNFLLSFIANSNDPMTMEMEEKRGEILRRVVSQAMPETAVGQGAAIDAFMAHLIGSLLGWQAGNDMDIREFLRGRTLVWIRLAGIPADGGEV